MAASSRPPSLPPSKCGSAAPTATPITSSIAAHSPRDRHPPPERSPTRSGYGGTPEQRPSRSSLLSRQRSEDTRFAAWLPHGVDQRRSAHKRGLHLRSTASLTLLSAHCGASASVTDLTARRGAPQSGTDLHDAHAHLLLAEHGGPLGMADTHPSTPTIGFDPAVPVAAFCSRVFAPATSRQRQRPFPVSRKGPLCDLVLLGGGDRI